MTAVQQWWGGVIGKTSYIPPGTFFIEDFENGLDLYTVLSGNPALWHLVDSPWGEACLRMDSAAGGAVNRISRPVPEIQFNRLQLKFRVTAAGTDDGGVIALRKNGETVVAFGVWRESYYDGAQRPTIQIGAGLPYLYIGSEHVPLNRWMVLTVRWLAEAGVSVLIQYEDTALAFIHTVIPTNVPLPLVDEMQLNDDNALGSAPTEWDDIYLFSE